MMLGREWIETVPRIGYRLPRIQAAAVLPSVLPSVAVLRFTNLSGDEDQDYFANGVVDEVLTALARFRSFAVIGRPIEPPAGGGPAELRRLSLDLGVRYLLDGTVRRVGAILRITARTQAAPFPSGKGRRNSRPERVPSGGMAA